MTPPENPAAPTPHPCVHCSYDLAGLPEQAICPECGVRAPDYNAHNSEILDAYTICPTCGYNLHGLPKEGLCPECGENRQSAMIEHSLYRSGAAYVINVSKGASLVLLAHYLVVAAIFSCIGGVFFGGLISARSGMNAGPGGGMLLGFVLYMVLALTSSIVWLVGWMKATPRDPALGHLAPSERHRSLTRAMAITLFCIQVASVVCSILYFLLPFLWLASSVCGIIMFYGSTSYIRSLGTRLPSEKLIKTTTRVRKVCTWVFALVGICASLLLIAGFAGLAGSSSILDVMAAILSLAIPLLLLVALLAYLRVINQFAKVLKEARNRADQVPARAHSVDSEQKTNTYMPPATIDRGPMDDMSRYS